MPMTETNIFKIDVLLPPKQPRVVEKHMAKVCNMSLVPDVSQPPNLDAWLRSSAADLKAWCGVEIECVPPKKTFPPKKIVIFLYYFEILFIKRTHKGETGTTCRSSCGGLHKVGHIDDPHVEQALHSTCKGAES